MSNDKIAFQLRIDTSLHTRLKEISDLELRSLNAQIEFFLIKGVEWYDRTNHQID